MYDVNAFLELHSNGQPELLKSDIGRYLEIEAEMDKLGIGNKDGKFKDLQSDAYAVVQQLIKVFGLTEDDIDVIVDNAAAFRELCSPIPTTS